MRAIVRCAAPIVIGTLALAHTGCGDKAPGSTPTSVALPASSSGGKATIQAVAPPLGSATSYAVLASSTVTNVPALGTTVNGDLGVSPGAAVTGFGPGQGVVVGGTIHLNDASAAAAQASITTAYGVLEGQACDWTLTGVDLGGLTLQPGVYCFATSAQLTGTLTLNGLGNAGAVWVFQIGSTLTTASGSSVNFINSGRSCGAFWQVGSSATFGTTTSFAGNVLALASITMNNGATSNGGLFARTAAVTLDNNTVTAVGSCGSGPVPPFIPPVVAPVVPPVVPVLPVFPVPPPGFPVPALPPGVEWILLAGLLGSGAYILRRH